MQLNKLKPAAGSKKVSKRKARGVGSGLGKTAGRGHKGQLSRSGLGPKPGFEGGQLPYHRRLPKFGFRSRQSHYREEIRLEILNKLQDEQINLNVLKQHNLIRKTTETVKVIATGTINRKVDLYGINATKQAKQLIEDAGGTLN
jgi:large subunit ribosomal protein L15